MTSAWVLRLMTRSAVARGGLDATPAGGTGMTDRHSSEVTNLDRYGDTVMPWSRPHDLLAFGPKGPLAGFFLGTVRPDGRPHAAGIGAVWHDGDLIFHQRARDSQGPEPGVEPGLHDLGQIPRPGLDSGRHGDASDRASDPGAGGRYLPRHRLAGRGHRRRGHRTLQRAERRAAAVASLPVHFLHRRRLEHGRAEWRDTLAVRPMTALQALPADQTLVTCGAPHGADRACITNRSCPAASAPVHRPCPHSPG